MRLLQYSHADFSRVIVTVFPCMRTHHIAQSIRDGITTQNLMQ